MSMGKLVVPLLVGAMLAGCSSLTEKVSTGFGLFGPPTPTEKISPLPEFKQTANAAQVWRQQVGAASAGLVFSPVLAGGSVLATGRDGQIARIADDGKQIWRMDSGRKLSGGVGTGNNLVLVGTTKGEVLAFDLDGNPLWTAKVSSEILSAPQAAEDTVVVRAGDGRVFGLNAKDGKRKWVYQRAMPPLALRSHAGVTITRGAVLVGFPGGKLVALNLSNGSVGWESTVALPRGATELERIADITSLPVVDETMACAVAYQGRVACFDLIRGNQLWTREISSAAGITMDHRYLFVSDDKGAVHALDKSSGASLWKQDKLVGRRLSAPTVVNGYIVVGDYQGYTHFMARDDGSFAARVATDGGAIVAPPLAVNGSVLLQTTNGGVFALSIQ